MNKQNAIRHALSKLRKYKKHPSIYLYAKSSNAFFNIESSPDFCLKCPHEDFGYCALRNSEMLDDEIFNKFCADAMINILEEII